MAKWDQTDLMLTEDGDLAINRGDLAVVSGQAYVAQSARNRIKTSDPDWQDYLVDKIGANLEDLRGKPNTRETAQQGMDLIGQAIMADGLVDSDQLYIQAVPTDKMVIAFFVFMNPPTAAQPFGFQINFGLDTGLVVRSVQT